MTFSERAKPLKEKSKLTLNEISSACNISESMVSRYINGQIVPPEDVARKILEFLGDAVHEEPQPEPEAADPVALSMLQAVYDARIEDMRANIVDLKESARLEKREKWIFVLLFSIMVFLDLALFLFDLSSSSSGWLIH